MITRVDSLSLTEVERPTPTGLRIFYDACNGNVAGTYRSWKDGRDDDSIVAIGYSHLFYDVCRRHGYEALVVANNRDCESVVDGPIEIRPLLKPSWSRRGGVNYYSGELSYGWRLARTAKAYGAGLAIVSMAAFPAALMPFALLRIPLIISLHNTFWSRGTTPAARQRRFRQATRWLWRNHVRATIVVSEECGRQVRELAGPPRGPVLVQVPQYRPGRIASTPPPPVVDSGPFRMLFAGRVEADKGVFQIVEAARRLEAHRPGQFQWRLAGHGGASDALARAVSDAGLERVVILLGQLKGPAVAEEVGRSHATLTPTTNGFAEGLAKLPLESVIAGRPAIVSSAVPAAEMIGGAGVEVPAGDVEALARAAVTLRDDPVVYARHVAACDIIRPRFFDGPLSWGAQLERAIRATVDTDPKRRSPRG